MMGFIENAVEPTRGTVLLTLASSQPVRVNIRHEIP
jgi:hypothetical protein